MLINKRFYRVICILLCFTAASGLAPGAGLARAYGAQEVGLEVTPVIVMPADSYEGHTEIVYDGSGYRYNGTAYGAENAYKENLVSVSFYSDSDEMGFDEIDGMPWKNEMSFYKAGAKKVFMKLTTYDGTEYTKFHYINVMKTPDTDAAVAGDLKQNRVQTLSWKTACNPRYPVKSTKVTITDEATGESVTESFDGLASSGGTFSAEGLESLAGSLEMDTDGRFYNGKKSFLVRNTSESVLITIDTEDVRGNTNHFTKSISITADEAPQADFEIASEYIREVGTDEAIVTLTDSSTSDGDQLERSWYVRDKNRALGVWTRIEEMPGFQDLSNGNGQEVQFKKTGVGRFEVKLVARDIVAESGAPSLVEGITPLESSVTKSSNVINVAPRVSIGMEPRKQADVLYISSISEEKSASAFESNLKVKALSENLEVDIERVGINGALVSSSSSSMPQETMSVSGAFGYWGRPTSFEDSLYIVDNKNLYRVDATWTDTAAGHPEPPYTVAAWDAAKGGQLWKLNFDTSTFPLVNDDAFLCQDDTEKYLYLVSNGKTMVLTKSTGQIAAILDFALGYYNYVRESIVYTYKSDGIYEVDLYSGKATRIYAANLAGASARVGGRIIAYTTSDTFNIMKISLDPLTGALDTDYLGRITRTELVPKGYTSKTDVITEVVDIDYTGTAILKISQYVTEGKAGRNSYKNYIVRAYSADNALLFSESASTRLDEEKEVTAVRDASGYFNYLVYSYYGNDSVIVELNGIRNGKTISFNFSNKYGNPAIYDSVIYAIEDGSDVYVTFGGYCTWIYDEGWANSRQGYPERCTTVRFGLDSKSGYKTSNLAGCDTYSEYSKSSDFFTAVHTGKNSQYPYNATLDTVVTKRAQSAYHILKRNISRYLSAEDAQYKKNVLLIDGDNLGFTLTSAEATEIKNLLSSKGCQAYVIGQRSTAKSLASALDATLVMDAETCAQKIASEVQIKSQSTSSHYTSATPKSSSNKNMTLTRTYNLSRDTKYYYEYNLITDDSNLASNSGTRASTVTHKTSSSTPGSTGKYYVTSEEAENFESSKAPTSNFFSYGVYEARDGKYTACYFYRERDKNADVSDFKDISFTVPEGKEGVISFDYEFQRPDECINGAYIEVDGERWGITETSFSTNVESGNYVYEKILTPGAHTLRLNIEGYGSSGMTGYFFIDNLRFSYLSKDASQASMDFKGEETVSRSSSEKYRVSGSFMTPGDTLEYSGMDGIEYITAVPGKSSYVTRAAMSRSNDYMINVPEGLQSIYTALQTQSRVDERAVSYLWENAGNIWKHYSTWRYCDFDSVGSRYRIILPPVTGSQKVLARYNYNHNEYAEITNVEMYLAPTGKKLDQKAFFIGDADGKRNLFLPSRKFTGSTSISIALAGSRNQISDFNLYTIENGTKVYLTKDGFDTQADLNNWRADNAKLICSSTYSQTSEEKAVNAAIPVFNKGEAISYDIQYTDFENDPSKVSYWKYTHTPLNDGENKSAAVILDSSGRVVRNTSSLVLDEPITRFYQDGKYTVEHWQYDDTSRGKKVGGNPTYDKKSNVVSYTFYIRGAGEAPWIRYITTTPRNPEEGGDIGLKIGVDDALKEKLSLTTEVYQGSRLIYKGTKSDITADASGNYGTIEIPGVVRRAECGNYKVVCIVSDEHAAGMDAYSFDVLSAGSVEGMVYHTQKWNQNRKLFNKHFFDTGYEKLSDFASYQKTDVKKRLRGQNVFWSGESFELAAQVGGNPVKVAAYIKDKKDFYTQLKKTSEKSTSTGKMSTYEGSLWDEDMLYLWRSEPALVTVVFEAWYQSKPEPLISEYNVIVDDSRLYWQLHRVG